MANFNTHLVGAAAGSSVLSSALLLSGLFSLPQGMLFWVAGILGGLLPDLDADNTALLRGLFNALGVVAAFVVLFALQALPLLHLWAVMLAAFLLVRFGLLEVFVRLTVHRGAFHSLLAAATFGLGTSFLGWRLLDQSIDMAWAMGGMVCAGYLIHLILDECFAVDLSGMAFKRSFGSALKPFSVDYKLASLVFLACALFFASALPAPQRLGTWLQDLPLHRLTQPASAVAHSPSDYLLSLQRWWAS